MLISLLCFVTKSRWEGERYWEGRWINSSLFFPSYLLGDRGVLFKLRGLWVIFAVELHWCDWILSWAMCMKNPREQGNPPRHCPGRTSIKLLAAVLEGSGISWDWDLPDEPAPRYELSHGCIRCERFWSLPWKSVPWLALNLGFPSRAHGVSGRTGNCHGI